MRYLVLYLTRNIIPMLEIPIRSPHQTGNANRHNSLNSQCQYNSLKISGERRATLPPTADPDTDA